GGGNPGAQAAVDFATYDPGPNEASGRILATDSLFSADLDVQNKIPGSPENPLVTTLKINAVGFVGIGTTVANRPLAIQGSGHDSDWIQFRDSADADQWDLTQFAGGVTFAESSAGIPRLFMGPSGDVGVNLTAPQLQLHLWRNDETANGA